MRNSFFSTFVWVVCCWYATITHQLASASSSSSGIENEEEESLLYIADFTKEGKGEKRMMQTLDDPVMGGSSHSYETQEEDYLKWYGEVEEVWFLRSPGFCIVETAGFDQTFPKNLGDYSGVSFVVNLSDDTLLPLSAQLDNHYFTSGSFWYPQGRRVIYHAKLTQISSTDDGKVELYAPWSEFKGMFHGQKVNAPPLDSVGLSHVDQVGLSTYWSHKSGKFEVKLYEIYARNHASIETEATRGLRANFAAVS